MRTTIAMGLLYTHNMNIELLHVELQRSQFLISQAFNIPCGHMNIDGKIFLTFAEGNLSIHICIVLDTHVYHTLNEALVMKWNPIALQCNDGAVGGCLH